MNCISIISGGQTGSDRGAVDAAIDCGVNYCGWIPCGRRDESGIIPIQYKNFRETFSTDFLVRTKFNIIEADATIFFYHHEIIKGTHDAFIFVENVKSPYIEIDFEIIDVQEAGKRLYEWTKKNGFFRLNIAGARASDDVEIYAKTYAAINLMLKCYGNGDTASINVDIVKHSYTETMVWCRHWDAIRWLVFAAIIAAIGAAMYAKPISIYNFFNVNITINCLICLSLGVFAMYLFRNLKLYHIENIKRHNGIVNSLLCSEQYKKIFIIDLPFEFVSSTDSDVQRFQKGNVRKRRTATEFLPLLILFFSLLSVVISLITQGT